MSDFYKFLCSIGFLFISIGMLLWPIVWHEVRLEETKITAIRECIKHSSNINACILIGKF